ncbi:MAG: 2-isopropylmalate synthase [Deferribacteres bacterium]|nr:2-isopropylmalate synthase [Deferribacteres bacterium]
MVTMQEIELIHDWNDHNGTQTKPAQRIEFDDETLRDGLQSPSAFDPLIREKLDILHLMVELGIQAADIALPAAGQRAIDDADAILAEIASAQLPIFPNCAARTVISDIEPIVDLSQKHGLAVEVACFIGSSPIRQFAESWDIDFLLKCTEEAVTFSVKNQLPVMFVTEDTVRAHPDHVQQLYETAIRCGAKRLCLTDTVGHATPNGARQLVQFVREIANRHDPEIQIDWHGHKDRGLSIANTLSAIEAGANRVHGTALGIGERCGNTPMELILVNCKLLGWIEQDLSALARYVDTVANATKTGIPINYPIVGHDAFRTATGVHASAIIKAQKKGQNWLADRVYSGVPASWFGREQMIEIGPMSGVSNVVFWLERNGYAASEKLVTAIFERAKKHEQTLTREEIEQIIHEAEN